MPRAFNPTLQKGIVRETNALFNCQLSPAAYWRGPKSEDGREVGIWGGGGEVAGTLWLTREYFGFHRTQKEGNFNPFTAMLAAPSFRK